MAYTSENEPVPMSFFSPDVFSTKSRALFKSYVVQVEKDLAELVEDLSNTNWHVKEAYATDLKRLMAKYRTIADQATEPENSSNEVYEEETATA
ncbi:MAG TPA: hypothetical protein ENL03_03850 [Phycisphaerae bacterium]|nr:hypothetical protein [Phycisphaerae bacterium]